MLAAEIIFWLALALLAYTYVGYPLLLGVWAKLRGRPVNKQPFDTTYTILLAVHNEERNIERRLGELCRLVQLSNLPGDIIVATDGCTDGTVARAQSFEETHAVRVHNEERNIERRLGELCRLVQLSYLPGDIIVATDGCTDGTVAWAQSFEETHPVRVHTLPDNRGKAAALSEAVKLAQGDILLFADVRQTWADDTIVQLLRNFSDPAVGAVSGDLKLETEPGVLAGVGLYWRFEKWLRKQESRVWSQVGVTGAVAAVRRELFTPIPPGTILDDVYWPLKVAMAGHRVIHDDSAQAFDRLPERTNAEFRRKVRTLAGNFQLAALIPASLVPWRNPVWLPWISHKLTRLASPWALLAMAVTPAIIGEPIYLAVLGVQAACYLVALAGMTPAFRQSRVCGAGASFLVLNAAAWVAFWVWILGRTNRSWRKTAYRESATDNLVAAEQGPT